MAQHETDYLPEALKWIEDAEVGSVVKFGSLHNGLIQDDPDAGPIQMTKLDDEGNLTVEYFDKDGVVYETFASSTAAAHAMLAMIQLSLAIAD